MSIITRRAAAHDFEAIEEMVIDSFEPITWQKQLDARFGLLNGLDWRARWQARLQKIFETQVVLLGEEESQLAAMASATLDRDAALAYIDLLSVDRRFQGRGLGREMLRAMIEHLKGLGMQYVHLDCLTNNDAGNALYRSEGFEEVAQHIRWFRKI
jgi:ribosomal protein S18 acetylase RimI-like enzyme